MLNRIDSSVCDFDDFVQNNKGRLMIKAMKGFRILGIISFGDY